MNAPDGFDVFLIWLGRTSLQASLLVMLIITVQALLRDRLAPRWRHALWLLLLVRLMLPWAPASGFSIYNLFPNLQLTLWAGAVGPSADRTPVPATSMTTDLISMSPTEEVEPASNRGIAPDPDTSSHQSRTASPGILWLWLSGVVAVLGSALFQSLSLSAAVRSQRPVTDQTLLDLLEDCKDVIRVRAWLMVIETPRVKSPALFGFMRPRLLLPAGTLQQLGHGHLRNILLHELAHLRRHDIALNWLATVLLALHWFNPLLWYAFYRMRVDRELACDALVLSQATPTETGAYGRTIIHLLETISNSPRQPSLARILEDRGQMKTRIAMIAKFKPNSYAWSATAALVMICLGCVALTNPTHKDRLNAAMEAEREDAVEDMVGTWFFTNPYGDDEQMAIFPDGRVIVCYSNGHLDETKFTNGKITLNEYELTLHMKPLHENTLLQFSDISGIAKVWQRIDTTPRTELLRPLTDLTSTDPDETNTDVSKTVRSIDSAVENDAVISGRDSVQLPSTIRALGITPTSENVIELRGPVEIQATSGNGMSVFGDHIQFDITGILQTTGNAKIIHTTRNGKSTTIKSDVIKIKFDEHGEPGGINAQGGMPTVAVQPTTGGP